MLPGTALFVALQTNTLQDIGVGYAENWSQMVEELQLRLEQQQFFCPKLEINFRNTSSIFENSNKMETVQGPKTSLQNTLGIPTIGTTLDASQVRQIFFNWNARNKKQADLDTALCNVLEKLENVFNLEDEPFVIMFDDTTFTMSQVYSGLKSSSKISKIFRYPSSSESDPEKEIDNFLSKPKGVLITTHGLFKGAEADAIISLQRSNHTGSNIRGTLLRAVSHLYILMGVAEHEYYLSKSTIDDDSLLYCFQHSYETAYACWTCANNNDNSFVVCLPCKKTHHANHTIWGRRIQTHKLDNTCQCSCNHK